MFKDKWNVTVNIRIDFLFPCVVWYNSLGFNEAVSISYIKTILENKKSWIVQTSIEHWIVIGKRFDKWRADLI
jgi:hypothetical protein